MTGTIVLGILLPFVGTSLGAAMVFFLICLVAYFAFRRIGKRKGNDRMASRSSRIRFGYADVIDSRLGRSSPAYRFRDPRGM